MASIIISLDAADLQKLANREELEVPIDIPVSKETQHYVRIRLTPNAIYNISSISQEILKPDNADFLKKKLNIVSPSEMLGEKRPEIKKEVMTAIAEFNNLVDRIQSGDISTSISVDLAPHLIDVTCTWDLEELSGRRLYAIGLGYSEDDLTDYEKELIAFTKEWQKSHKE